MVPGKVVLWRAWRHCAPLQGGVEEVVGEGEKLVLTSWHEVPAGAGWTRMPHRTRRGNFVDVHYEAPTAAHLAAARVEPPSAVRIWELRLFMQENRCARPQSIACTAVQRGRLASGSSCGV